MREKSRQSTETSLLFHDKEEEAELTVQGQ